MNKQAAIQQGIDGLLFLKSQFNSPDYDEAILALEVIQMGLDDECEVEYLEDHNGKVIHWKECDEKALGWRESKMWDDGCMR